MKHLLYILPILLIISCNNNTNENTKKENKKSDVIDDEYIDNEDDGVKKSTDNNVDYLYLELLDSLIFPNKTLHKDYTDYLYLIANKGALNSDKSINNIFAKRDNEILPKLDKFFKNIKVDFLIRNYAKLSDELRQIGLMLIIDEGSKQYLGMSPIQFLDEDIDLLAKEDFKLYLTIKDKYLLNKKISGPVEELTGDNEILTLCDDLESKYQNSSYISKLDEYRYNSLLNFVDIYKVKNNASFEIYVRTNKENSNKTVKNLFAQNKFLKNSKSSKFFNVISSVTRDVSEITLNKPFYIVAVEQFDNEQKCKDFVISNISSNVSVVHYFKLKKLDGKESYIAASRLYDLIEKAEAKKQVFKNKFNNIQIIKAKIKDGVFYESE